VGVNVLAVKLKRAERSGYQSIIVSEIAFIIEAKEAGV